LLEGGSLDLDAFAVPGVAPPDHLVDEAAVGSEILEVARAAQQELIAKHIVLGRTDFFDFVGRLVFVCLRVFDLAATRFELVFDLTRRFDEVLDLARFFAFFMIFPRSTDRLVPPAGFAALPGVLPKGTGGLLRRPRTGSGRRFG
jgi:hypothetical protein